jgi:hypothetical protein
MNATDWQLYVTAEQFMHLRSDPRLGAIIALGRVANALTLVAPVVQQPLNWEVPRVRRERTAALFYVAATLHEGLRVAESLGAHFRHLPEYKLFVALQNDPQVTDLRRRLLKPLRDKAVFHFDKDVTDLIGTLETTDDVILVSGKGPEVGATYIDFADTVVLHYLLGLHPLSGTSVWNTIRELLERTNKLYTAFLIAAHSVMPPALHELGVRERTLPPRHP